MSEIRPYVINPSPFWFLFKDKAENDTKKNSNTTTNQLPITTNLTTIYGLNTKQTKDFRKMVH